MLSYVDFLGSTGEYWLPVFNVAHSILTIAYHLISRQEPYKDLGSDYFDKQRPESVKKRLVKRLEKLGYQDTVEPVPVAS